jgi:hypothetical protein
MPQQRHSVHLNPNESLTETWNPSDSRRVSNVCCYSFLSASLVLGPPVRPVREITDEAIPSKVVGKQRESISNEQMGQMYSPNV